LVDWIFPSSIPYYLTFSRLVPYFVAQGTMTPYAERQADACTGREILNQALLLAYIGVYWALGALALVMADHALPAARPGDPKRRRHETGLD
jgi:hypothetical protein